MSVIIDDTCITCDACLQQCPVNAIVDDMSSPMGNKRYYVQPEKCIECVGVSSVLVFMMIHNVQRFVRASDVSHGICPTPKSLMHIF
jgi:ferredoxin